MEELRRCSAKLERQLAEEQAAEELRARMPDVGRRVPLGEQQRRRQEEEAESLFSVSRVVAKAKAAGGGDGGGGEISAPAEGLRAVEPPARRSRGGSAAMRLRGMVGSSREEKFFE
jgi:hypothetical protein